MTTRPPDYGSYDEEELLDALAHVDESRFPERAESIRRELARRGVRDPDLAEDRPESTLLRAVRPWSQVLGALAIVYGCMVVYGGANQLVSPWIASRTAPAFDQLVGGAAGRTDVAGSASGSPASPWSFPEWYVSWSIAIGLLGLAAGGILIVAGLRVLTRGRRAVTLLRVAALSVVAVGAVRVVVALSTQNVWTMSGLPGGVLAIVVGGVLFRTVAPALELELDEPEAGTAGRG